MSDDIATEVLSASIAGIISSSTLYPLEMIKTRMQASAAAAPKKKEKSTKESGSVPASPESTGSTSNSSAALTTPAAPTARTTAADIYAEGGVFGFWKQFHYSAAQSALEKGLYFCAYTALKSGYKSATNATSINAGASIALGCVAEWAHLPVTLPFDVLTTQIATDKTDRSAFMILQAVLSEKGVGGMYKGVSAFVVLCLKPAIQYTAFDSIKGLILASKRKGERSLTALEAFVAGMVARTVATLIVYPYTRAKVMIQCGGGTDSIPVMLKGIWDDEGLGGIYQGIGPELTRGVLSAALMLMVKEKITEKVARSLGKQNQSYY